MTKPAHHNPAVQAAAMDMARAQDIRQVAAEAAPQMEEGPGRELLAACEKTLADAQAKLQAAALAHFDARKAKSDARRARKDEREARRPKPKLRPRRRRRDRK